MAQIMKVQVKQKFGIRPLTVPHALLHIYITCTDIRSEQIGSRVTGALQTARSHRHCGQPFACQIY
jgi:hypothetical protein